MIIAGGLVRRSDGGIVGEAAVDLIRQFKVDYAVIGVSAIDDDGALLDFDYREVRAAQAIIETARHVILVADSMKVHPFGPGSDRPYLASRHFRHRPRRRSRSPIPAAEATSRSRSLGRSGRRSAASSRSMTAIFI